MSSISIHFFATFVDLRPAMEFLEAEYDLKYIESSSMPTDQTIEYQKAADIPRVGESSTGDSVTDPQYLVIAKEVIIIPRAVPQRKGGIRYLVDPLCCPRSAVVSFGGSYGLECVIGGSFGTSSTDLFSVGVVRRFGEALRSFKSVRGTYVGPEAEILWRRGARLTSGVKRPRLSDLNE
jgi:hypothetical protein